MLLAAVAAVIVVELLLASSTRNRGRETACEQVLARANASAEMMRSHLDKFEESSRLEMAGGTSAGSLSYENKMRNLSHRLPTLVNSLRDCAADLVDRGLISPKSMALLDRDIRVLDDAYLLIRRPPEWFYLAAASVDPSACRGSDRGPCLAPCDPNASHLAASIADSMNEVFAMAKSMRGYDLRAASAHELAWERSYRQLITNVEKYCACLPECDEPGDSPNSAWLAIGLEWEHQARTHAPAALRTLRDALAAK